MPKQEMNRLTSGYRKVVETAENYVNGNISDAMYAVAQAPVLALLVARYLRDNVSEDEATRWENACIRRLAP